MMELRIPRMEPIMKATAIPLAVAAVLFATNASAHGNRDDDSRYAPYPPVYGYPSQAQYVKVKVVDVDRVSARAYYDERVVCDTRDERRALNAGSVAGALIGGVVGSQVGKGDGRVLATVAGATIGGIIGHSLDSNDARPAADCYRPTQVRGGQDMYRVTYRYQGEYFTTWLPYRPGKHLQLRRHEVGQPYSGQYATRW